ncbi:MAG: lipocalin family protein [Candidatus Krumholzibacteriota bacterium]|nr:lipocalin family protein [Candidatus Krumholzibacteriota bacterium]
MRISIAGVLLLLLPGCLGIPENVSPVEGFELNRYLGKWYEIARLDHSFERGLDNVTAEYSMHDDGGVKIVNRGFSVSRKSWKEAEGKAYFVKQESTGYLKVSFFGPFYGSYVIFDLDRENYQYAFISGSDKSYLWFLSRTPEVEKDLIDIFVRKADSLGFETDKLIYVKQDRSIQPVEER